MRTRSAVLELLLGDGRTDRTAGTKRRISVTVFRELTQSDTANAGVQCCRLLLTETQCQSRLASYRAAHLLYKHKLYKCATELYLQ
jgi:hypothetical protein